MSSSPLRLGVITTVTLLISAQPTSLRSQAQRQEVCTLEHPAPCSLVTAAALRDALLDPATLNEFLRRFVSRASGLDRLGILELRFKTFYGADSSHTSLGLTYQYHKSITRTAHPPTAAMHRGFELTVDAAGNVAFQRNLNPRDFLEGSVEFGAFRSSGGVTSMADSQTNNTLGALVDSLAKLTKEELERSPLLVEASRLFLDRLSTQVFTRLATSARLESDQSFHAKQFVYGLTFGLDIKAWNPTSGLARLNILDWPFAALRYLSGMDRELQPRGSTLPTMLVSLDLVDPAGDTQREVLGENAAFPRLRLEGAFRTAVGQQGETRFFFEADARYYRELGASSVIRQANLDESRYLALAFTASNGMFVSYSTGRLPFDARNDKVWELGFKYQL
jgi:hypothetical protein